MYRILRDDQRWLVVRVVGDSSLLLHTCKTHAEALHMWQDLKQLEVTDTYDNYVEPLHLFEGHSQ